MPALTLALLLAAGSAVPGTWAMHSPEEDFDLDADTWGELEGDCNDIDPSIHPGAPEVADNDVDEDCDGHDAHSEICDDGADNDGNGTIDDIQCNTLNGDLGAPCYFPPPASPFGYVTCLSGFGLFDVPPNATVIELGDDEVSGPIALPFAFPFYGAFYNETYVSSNGFITFQPGSDEGCCNGQDMPWGEAPNGLITGVWEDLNPESTTSVTAWSEGGANQTVFVVSFESVPYYYYPNETVTFQIVLHENGDFEQIVASAAALGEPDFQSIGYECSSGDGLTVHKGIGAVSEGAWRTYYPENATVALNCAGSGDGGGGGGEGGGGCGGDTEPGLSNVTVLVTLDDAPLPYTFVDLYSYYYPNVTEPVDFFCGAETDENGEAFFTGLPAGDFEASACAFFGGCRAVQFTSDGQAGGVFVPDPNGTGNQTVEVELVALRLTSGFIYQPPDVLCGGTLAGYVLDAEGLQPVAGARVSVNPSDHLPPAEGNGWGYAEADADGHFVVSMLGDGVFDLNVEGYDQGLGSLYATQAFRVEDSDPEGCDDEITPAVVDTSAFGEGAYAFEDDHFFFLERGMTLSGSVTDGDAPVPETWVCAHSRSAFDPETGEFVDAPMSGGCGVTDADGYYTIPGLTAIEDDDGRTGFDVYVNPPFGSGFQSAGIHFPDEPVQGEAPTGSCANPGGADLDADGAGDAYFDGDGPGGSSGCAGSDGDGEAIDPRLDFTLRPGARVHGVVFDAGSLEGVGDTWLNAWGFGEPSWASDVSDNDGAYELTGLAYDERSGVPHGMWVQPPFDSGFASQFLEFNLDSADLEMDIPLAPSATLGGCLVDGDGDPVAWAWVNAYGDGSSAGWGNSGEDGCFALHALAADQEYSVSVYPPWGSGLENRVFVPVALDVGSPWFDNATVTPLGGQAFLLHDEGEETILLAEAGHVTGCVVDEEGEPVRGAWVSMYSHATGQWAGGVTGGRYHAYADVEDGCFDFLASGADDYSLTIWPPLGEDLVQFNLHPVEVAQGGETQVTDGVDDVPGGGFEDEFIQLGGGHRLVGDVLLEDGSPASGVYLYAWREDFQGFGMDVTDGEGHFEIGGLPPPDGDQTGEGWRIWVSPQDGSRPGNYPYDPHMGTAFPNTGDFAESADLLGGLGRIIYLNATNGTTLIDSDFDLPDDPTPDGFSPIVLDGGATLPGFVLDTDGEAVAGAEVHLWGDAGWGFDATDADGAWDIGGLAGEGDLNAWVLLPDGSSFYESSGGSGSASGCQLGDTDDDAGGDDTDGEALDGCVLQAQQPGDLLVDVLEGGEPVAGAYVSAYGPGFASGATDGDGRVAFTGLPPGNYTVHVSADGHYAEFAPAQVTQGGAAEIDVELESYGPRVDFEGDVEAGGEPAPNAIVLALLEGEGGNFTTYSITTDADGHYLFEGLPEGNYTIRALLDEDRQASFDVGLDVAGDTGSDDPDSDGILDSDGDGAAEALATLDPEAV